MQELVNGYQAKLASQGQTTKTRHPGGRGGGKRGGKVLVLPLSPSVIPQAIWSLWDFQWNTSGARSV